MKPLMLLSSIFIATFLILTNTSLSKQDQQQQISSLESHRVYNLPGQPNQPPISQFSGHITVDEHNGRALFYWFFEAQSYPSNRPLLLWFNGGPGCSSIGYGAAVELGPLRVNNNGGGLEFNKFAWNNESNLLFVESPVGVGFSYTNTTSDLSKLDDGFVAEDAYSFLVNWFKRFPRYQTHDFYIAGESYAGHYVPQLAELVYDRNVDKKKYPYINLKGFMVGNPETQDYYDTKGLVEYAWSHSVISDQLFLQINKVCNFRLPKWTQNCTIAMIHVFQQYKEIDIYNIYSPKCFEEDSSSSTTMMVNDGDMLRKKRIPSGYDPCFSTHAEEYFNRDDVKASLHVNLPRNIAQKWKTCSDSILHTYNFTVTSVLPIYPKLIQAGLRIWLYSGDADGRVPIIGSRYCVESLGLPLVSDWTPWYHNNQVGGRFVEYKGLTMATVRGAGHLVPLNKPSEALKLINTFLSGSKLPTKR